MLNFSRPLKIEKQKNSINRIIEEAVKNSKYITGDKKISFKKIHGEIPEFYFDYAQIQEVITNIITNAVQAINLHGEIKIKTFYENGTAVIDISDNGPGIPKENREKIFKPFFSSKGYGKGTGLGLSISKKILKEHGGDITVKSHTGKGTTFTITLPVN